MTDEFELYRRFREDIENTFLPYRQISDQMHSLIDPFAKFKEQINQVLEPQRKLREQVELWMEPYRRLQEKMASFAHPTLELRNRMEKWLEPYRRLREQLISSAQLRSQMQKFSQAAYLLNSRLQSFNNPQIELSGLLNSVLEGLEAEDINVSSSGEISVAGESVEASETDQLLENIFIGLKKLPNLKDALIFLKELFSKVKKPITIIVLLFLLPFLLNVTSNISTQYFEDILSKYCHLSRSEKTKIIHKEVAKNLDLSMLSDYRFTTTDILNVRERNFSRSKRIGQLSFGQCVRLIEKKRKWSYVEYVDEETEREIQGWVFNRYLARFSK